MLSMRVHHNGVFKYWPGRIYDGGMKSFVDLVYVDSVSVEELDVLMYKLGYDLGQKNYYYFVKPGSNLDDDLYRLSEAANLEILKDVVEEHKMIEVYVENGKKSLDVDDMSPKPIRKVISQVDASKKNASLAIVPYCSKQLFLENIVKKPVVEGLNEVRQPPLEVNAFVEYTEVLEIEPLLIIDTHVDHIQTDSPVSVEHSQTDSPFSVNHSRKGSPIYVDHSQKDSPISVNHSHKGSPVSVDHSQEDSSVSVDHSQKDSSGTVDHSQKGSPVEVCETEQEFGHLDEKIHTPVDRMQKGKSINLCETDEELGDENVSETDNYETDVDDIENNQDGNTVVDEENIFDEPDVEVAMFKLIDTPQIDIIGSLMRRKMNHF
jgi:hypothetical protein